MRLDSVGNSRNKLSIVHTVIAITGKPSSVPPDLVLHPVSDSLKRPIHQIRTYMRPFRRTFWTVPLKRSPRTAKNDEPWSHAFLWLGGEGPARSATSLQSQSTRATIYNGRMASSSPTQAHLLESVRSSRHRCGWNLGTTYQFGDLAKDSGEYLST